MKLLAKIGLAVTFTALTLSFSVAKATTQTLTGTIQSGETGFYAVPRFIDGRALTVNFRFSQPIAGRRVGFDADATRRDYEKGVEVLAFDRPWGPIEQTNTYGKFFQFQIPNTDYYRNKTGTIRYYNPTAFYTDIYAPASAPIGYSISVISGGVPEPSTWALIIMGFGAIGLALRGQRRRLLLAQISA